MEPVAQSRMIKSLQDIDRKVVAMCTHDKAIYIATEHEVYRLEGDVWTQLEFKVIE